MKKLLIFIIAVFMMGLLCVPAFAEIAETYDVGNADVLDSEADTAGYIEVADNGSVNTNVADPEEVCCKVCGMTYTSYNGDSCPYCGAIFYTCPQCYNHVSCADTKCETCGLDLSLPKECINCHNYYKDTDAEICDDCGGILVNIRDEMCQNAPRRCAACGKLTYGVFRSKCIYCDKELTFGVVAAEVKKSANKAAVGVIVAVIAVVAVGSFVFFRKKYK